MQLDKDFIKGIKLKIKNAEKKILGKGEKGKHGLIDLGCIKKEISSWEKEADFKDTSPFRIKGVTACLK